MLLLLLYLYCMTTLFEKLWQAHIVREARGEPTLLYIDLHLIHEVTSPQAFEGLRQAGRKVRRPDLTFGTVDHNVPTTDRNLPIADATAANRSRHCVTTAKSLAFNSSIFTPPNKASFTSLDRSLV